MGGWVYQQIIIKISFMVLSRKGFNVNLMFHVLQLICDFFLMVNECLKR
jgi:hypothetical protein